jgi:hypothetical protein
MLKGLFNRGKNLNSASSIGAGLVVPTDLFATLPKNHLPWVALAPQQWVLVTPEGLRVYSLKGMVNNQLSAIGKQWHSIRPALVSQGLLRTSPDQAVDLMDFETLYSLLGATNANDDDGLDLRFFNPTIANITPTITSSGGSLGSPDFSFSLNWLDATTGQAVYPQVVGAFVLLAGQSTPQLLQQACYQLLGQLEQWQSLPPEQKTLQASLLALASLKALNTPVVWDAYLSAENPVVLGQVGLGLHPTEGGRVSVYPTLPPTIATGHPTAQTAFRQAFFKYGQVQPTYTVDVGDSASPQRLRLVCTPEVQTALTRMRPMAYLDKPSQDRLALAPQQVFDGLVNTGQGDQALEASEGDLAPITLEGYASRVSGVGPYVYSPRPFLRYFQAGEIGLLGTKPPDDDDEATATGDGLGTSPSTQNDSDKNDDTTEQGLQVTDADGTLITLPLANERAISQAKATILQAMAQGQHTTAMVDDAHVERWIPVTPDLLSGLDELQQAYTKAKAGDLPEGSGQHLLVFKNDDCLAYAEPDDLNLTAKPFECPVSLKSFVVLKPYQVTGITWLQSCYASQRKGVLLADDMGLGKTLQVMAFLAWCLEQKERSENDNRPILIVAPVSLLDNWEAEMRKFFADDGAIFSPMVKLYADNLKAYKNPNVSRKDETLNSPALNIDKLRQATVILTNYETVAHYEYSFTQLPWLVVAADEAQKIKNDNTDASHVLRALDVKFRIAMTGTPVENRLLDLWAIMDFAQPGILGFKRQFSECYELNDLSQFAEQANGKPLPLLTDEQRQQAEQAMAADIERRAEQLQKSLRHGEFPQTFLLNRDKKDHLDDLPPKTEHVLPYTLSPQQEIRYQEILDLARGLNQADDQQQGQHLLAIHHLKRLHEHPLLLEAAMAGEPQRNVLDKPTAELLSTSRKLQAVVACLEAIAGGGGEVGGDKVLIFTPSIMMQLILKRVLDERFGLDVDIINGSPKDNPTSKAKADHNPNDSERTRILKRFAASQGFNVLVLSPLAAGAGLNITCANHVIHYGRWWNPAVEAQATCRVYRIGQTKPVHVYYPIAQSATFNPTFEQTLHRLLEKKEAIRRNFLRPMPPFSLDIVPAELLQ